MPHWADSLSIHPGKLSLECWLIVETHQPCTKTSFLTFPYSGHWAHTQASCLTYPVVMSCQGASSSKYPDRLSGFFLESGVSLERLIEYVPRQVVSDFSLGWCLIRETHHIPGQVVQHLPRMGSHWADSSSIYLGMLSEFSLEWCLIRDTHWAHTQASWLTSPEVAYHEGDTEQLPRKVYQLLLSTSVAASGVSMGRLIKQLPWTSCLTSESDVLSEYKAEPYSLWTLAG